VVKRFQRDAQRSSTIVGIIAWRRCRESAG
jgi:hypothetical protein